MFNKAALKACGVASTVMEQPLSKYEAVIKLHWAASEAYAADLIYI